MLQLQTGSAWDVVVNTHPMNTKSWLTVTWLAKSQMQQTTHLPQLFGIPMVFKSCNMLQRSWHPTLICSLHPGLTPMAPITHCCYMALPRHPGTCSHVFLAFYCTLGPPTQHTTRRSCVSGSGPARSFHAVLSGCQVFALTSQSNQVHNPVILPTSKSL